MQKEIGKIWSREEWERIATRIELGYWNILKEKIPNVPPPKTFTNTEHRIEQFVRELSDSMGIGNLHVGLTSSDLCDNIRVDRIKRNTLTISKRLSSYYTLLSGFLTNTKLVAYTHLLPAGKTTIGERILPILEAHKQNPYPTIIYRGIKGSLGLNHIQHKLGISDTSLRKLMREIFGDDIHIQNTSHQTGNHLTEFNVAVWLAWETALLTKMANDFRMMFALGQAMHTHKDIGSTAIAGKRPNPWRFERVSGMSDIIYDLPAKVSRVAANCLLERTLTNQSTLNYVFKESFLLMDKLISDMETALLRTEVVRYTGEDKFDSEERMVELILAGKSRLEAHKQINQEENEK